MKKISLILATFITVAMLLTACGGGSTNSSHDSEDRGSADWAGPSEDGLKTDYGDAVVGNDIYLDENNKVIRTATMGIQTTGFDAAVDALNQLVAQYEGYYESAEVEGGNFYNQHANRTAYFVVRIPKENFDLFKQGSGGIGYLRSISESTKDVGENYADAEARLETLNVKRERILALLEEAKSLEDVIYLEQILADVQYEIDSYSATLRKYDGLIGYSTFNITISEVATIVTEPAVTETFGAKLLANLKSGFAEFGEGLQSFVLWFARNLIGIIVFVAVVVVVVVFGVRRIRRRKAIKQQDTEQK